MITKLMLMPLLSLHLTNPFAQVKEKAIEIGVTMTLTQIDVIYRRQA